MDKEKDPKIISAIDRRSFLKGFSTTLGTPKSLVSGALINTDVARVVGGSELIDEFVKRALGTPLIKHAMSRTGLSKQAIRVIAERQLALAEAQKKYFLDNNPDIAQLIKETGGTLKMNSWYRRTVAQDLSRSLRELGEKGIEFLNSSDFKSGKIFSYGLEFPDDSLPRPELPSGNILRPTIHLNVDPDGVHFVSFRSIFDAKGFYLRDVKVRSENNISELKNFLLGIRTPVSVYTRSVLENIDADFYQSVIEQKVRQEARQKKYQVEKKRVETAFKQQLLSSTALAPVDKVLGKIPENFEDVVSPTVMPI